MFADRQYLRTIVDGLRKALERETVLAIADELEAALGVDEPRERWTFETPAGPASVEFPVPRTRAEVDAALKNIPELAKRAWSEVFRDPEQHPLNLEARQLTAELTGIAPMHQAGVIERERPMPAPESGVDFERPDLNDSDDFEVEP